MICFFLLFALSTAFAQQGIFERGIGPCIGGQCQAGYGCLYGQCVPKPEPSRAVGPCIGNSCPGGTFCFQGECFQKAKRKAAKRRNEVDGLVEEAPPPQKDCESNIWLKRPWNRMNTRIRMKS